MNQKNLMVAIKENLKAAHGGRLQGIVLFGSEARGQSDEDSDIDVLVLLDGAVDYAHDLRVNIQALLPLSLSLNRPISAKPVNGADYETQDCPLFRHVHREGIRL